MPPSSQQQVGFCHPHWQSLLLKTPGKHILVLSLKEMQKETTHWGAHFKAFL